MTPRPQRMRTQDIPGLGNPEFDRNVCGGGPGCYLSCKPTRAPQRPKWWGCWWGAFGGAESRWIVLIGCKESRKIMFQTHFLGSSLPVILMKCQLAISLSFFTGIHGIGITHGLRHLKGSCNQKKSYIIAIAYYSEKPGRLMKISHFSCFCIFFLSSFTKSSTPFYLGILGILRWVPMPSHPEV